MCCTREPLPGKGLQQITVRQEEGVQDFSLSAGCLIHSQDKKCQEKKEKICGNLFLREMSQAAVLARTVGECREGQIPRPLGRCKLDTPLLAAGSLIGLGRRSKWFTGG